MKKSGGILALLGLGAYAFYKYTKMSPDEKEKVQGKLEKLQKNVKENLDCYTKDLKEGVSGKLDQAKEELKNLKKEAKHTKDELVSEAKEQLN